MRDWTEQEEQEMIQRAKDGDPQANYELSLWALERSEEEPDEPRWNRLAAKCLVKAAQAGYGPAQDKMAGLLAQAEPPKATRPRTSAPKAEAPEPVRLSDARQGLASRRPAPQRTARQAPARRPAPKKRAVDVEYDDEYDEEDEDEHPVRRKESGKKAGIDLSAMKIPSFSQWGDAQWRKLELVCIGICAVLIIAIAVMFITGRGSGGNGDSQNSGSSVPPAGQVEPADTTATDQPEQSDYPTEDIIAAILASDIEVEPADLDYVSSPIDATVSVSGTTSLRLRTGPSTSYKQVTDSSGSNVTMPDGSTVSVFARKNNWTLVLYEGGSSPVYGWCSSEYLIESVPTSVG